MKQLLISIITALIFSSTVMAAPFLICDPQPEAEGYVLEFNSIPLVLLLTAEADGSLKYDLATWASGGGWFSGVAKATSSYEVVDETTGAASSVVTESDESRFRLKIPRNVKPQNYKVQN